MIDNLPSLEGQFLCVFQALGKTLVTNATRTPNGVSCTTPRNDLLPLIPANEHHFTSELSVRMADGPDFVSTNFTFFGKIHSNNDENMSKFTVFLMSPLPLITLYRSTLQIHGIM